MPRFSASLDFIVRARLRPALVRAYWSTDRAWPGETVKACVETRYVPDDTELILEVRSAHEDSDAPALATIDGLTISGGRCVVDHEIAWEDDALADLFSRDDPGDEFCFDVLIDHYALTTRSTTLYVPLEPFIASH